MAPWSATSFLGYQYCQNCFLAIIQARWGDHHVSEPRLTDGDRQSGPMTRSPGQDLSPPLSAVDINLINEASSLAENSDGQPGNEEQARQIRHILSSRSFRSAPLLQKFLQFITAELSQGRQDELSEYAIATQVFGRAGDFDPAFDTIVRTQAYRLRTKLKEYYENEGKTERVIVDVPKGRYVPTFAFRQDPAARTDAAPQEAAGSDRAVSWFQPPSRMILAGTVLVVIAFMAGTLVGRLWIPFQSSPVMKEHGVPEPVATFWNQFLGDSDIILAYTNGVFLSTETGDLLRFRHSGAIADRGALVGRDDALADALNPPLVAAAGNLYYEESFTGTGEVLATYRLANLLTRLGAKVQPKRSGLVTVDDLKNHDVIFLGSPFDNQVLAEMHFPQRFSFEPPTRPPYLWRGRIVDHKATPSAISHSIERDPQSQVIRADYALFDVLPGVVPGRRILVLAGITTSGTEGAAEFATSADGLRKILALGTNLQNRGHDKTDGDSAGKTFPQYFESLLRVEAEKGLEAINTEFIDGSVVRSQR
jgi:hypothetical protein